MTGTILTPDQLQIIMSTAERFDGDVRSYSGRGMYGKTCLGIVADSAQFVMSFILDVQQDDPDLAAILSSQPMRTDDMGLSIILYWPGISFDAEDNDE